MWSDALGGFDHASLASELAANRRCLLSCRLSLATSTPPHIALFSAPLHSYPSTWEHEAVSTLHKTAGGSASPKGEARRNAPPRRSKATAAPGRTTGGVGGRCNQTRPQAHQPPPHHTRGSASPKGEARRTRAAKAKRSDRRAREDYGWGWAGGVTKPPNPPNAGADGAA